MDNAGLITQAQQARPADAVSQISPEQIPEMEEPTEEEQAAFDQAIAQITKAIMSPKYQEGLIQRVSQSNRPLRVIADESANVVASFDTAILKGAIPGDMIISLALNVAVKIMGVFIKGGVIEDNEENAQKVGALTIAAIAREYEEAEPDEQPEGAEAEQPMPQGAPQ